jgi:hypothetical protein
MITGYDLINEYYEDEKLYSTGDSDLDDLLERAFSEGYEYAQREFGNKENKRKRREHEVSMAKGALKSLGYGQGEENVKDMLRVNRLRNRAGVTNAEIESIANIKQELAHREPTRKTSLDQRINTKGAFARSGNASLGFDRIKKFKEIMNGRNRNSIGPERWEAIIGGKRGASNQDLWDSTR